MSITLATPKASPSKSKKTRFGVVNYCVYGRGRKIAAGSFTTPQIIQALRDGLPVKELEALRHSLALPMDQLVPILGLSNATLHRRKKAGGRLDAAESGRVVRYAKLMGQAIEVLESEENARKWLSLPQAGLGGAVPLRYAETEVGAREVEDLLGRIEYGVYS